MMHLRSLSGLDDKLNEPTRSITSGGSRHGDGAARWSCNWSCGQSGSGFCPGRPVLAGEGAGSAPCAHLGAREAPLQPAREGVHRAGTRGGRGGEVRRVGPGNAGAPEVLNGSPAETPREARGEPGNPPAGIEPTGGARGSGRRGGAGLQGARAGGGVRGLWRR